MFVAELILIILAVLIGISIIWSTVIAGISPMPSSKKAQQAVLQLVETAEEEASAGAIVDLGSGWGGLVIKLAQKYPDRKIVGYELSIIPWFVSVCVAKCLGLNNLTLYRQDFLKADLSMASIMVCYLYPEGMAALEAKLAELPESPKGSRYLISNNFALPSYKPEQTIQLDDFYRSPVYLYRVSS